MLATALRVESASLRLPESAGTLRPADYLPAPLREAFESVADRVTEEQGTTATPRPCYLVSKAEEQHLRRRLVRSRMARLIPESDIARRSEGRLLLNGLFGVHHRHGQRAIFDLRPANHSEGRLRWSTLPLGSMFSFFRLSPDKCLRGSGDDLETYFYHWQESESMVPRRAFGRCITGAEALELGGTPGKGTASLWWSSAWVA